MIIGTFNRGLTPEKILSQEGEKMLFCMRNNFCDKQQTIVVLCNLSVTHFSLGYVFTSIKMPSVWEEKDL